ncbi:hypothetical protein ACKZDW_05140 (plasmid) [Ralstonia syzygii subsp. celebesensis]
MNTSGLVQRAQRGLQKLQGTRHSRAPKPDVSSTRLPVTVPDSEPRYRQLLAQGFAATQDARAVGSLADRLRGLAPPLAEEAGERPATPARCWSPRSWSTRAARTRRRRCVSWTG